MEKVIKFAAIALQNFRENKNKTLLTMLGIIIGISAVIMVVSVGKSAENMILFSIESFGPKSIFIQPGGGEGTEPSSLIAIDKLKYKDYLAIKSSNLIEDVSAFLIHQGTVTYESESQNTRIVGADENYLVAMKAGLKEGRFIESTDVLNEGRIAVLGSKTASELFGDGEALGKKVRMSGKYFQVIGVLTKQGTRFFQDFDSRVLVPISTMKSQIKGVDYVSVITGNVLGPMEETIEDVRKLLRKRHGLTAFNNDRSKDDFRVVSQKDAADMFLQISTVLSVFLILIASISLLVGGIGIMNIMLVSVSERTREIGLRKAVGANNRDILLQFLVESVILTLMAGILGIIAGVMFSGLTALIMKQILAEWEFIVTVSSVVMAFSVSVVIGIVFGLYPALTASRLDPIQALIEET